MADSSEQQTSTTELSAFGQDDVRNLHVGLLLFSNKDFTAIKDTLLPEKKVEEIVHFYCRNYTYTKAHSLVYKLEHSGFQPGALVSGNMRSKVLNNLSSAIGRILKNDKTLTAAFKAYDACSMPLLDLVEALIDAVGTRAFGKAMHEELGTIGVDLEQLTLSDLRLDWDELEHKLQRRPGLFESVLWPVLENAGWKHGPIAQPATADSPAQQDAGAPASDAVAIIRSHPFSVEYNTSGSEAGKVEQQELYVPPAAVAADYLANVGEPVPPCHSPEDVVGSLKEAGQPVPAGCIINIREAELHESLERFSQVSPGLDAPHRHTHDPSAKRPGTPITSRKFMCANCSISTSTVWRTGNAGLTLCNACGMFYNKHDHEHRPEHLIASARAKAEAQQQAAAAAAASGSPMHKIRHNIGLRSYTPDGHTDGEMSDDARRGSFLCGSESGDDDDDEGGRRPRTRRRAQVSKWLASDDYLMLDGPLRTASNPGMGWSMPQATAYAGFTSMYEDARSYDGQRRNTASPIFGASHSRRGVQQQKGGFGFVYEGRSRSVGPESYPCQQERWQDGGGYAGSRSQFQDRAGYMDWEDAEGAGGQLPGAGDQEEWQQQDLDDRPLEDMESLLGRILINSPSDASDSSAANALVAMSQSCISQHEQNRLHAAISCDIRAASSSPGPTSILRRSVAVAAAAACIASGEVYSPTKSGLGRTEALAGSRAGAVINSQQQLGEQERLEQEQPLVEEQCADDADDADRGMDVDVDDTAEQQAQEACGDDDLQAEQEQQRIEQAPGDGFSEAWARVQASAGTVSNAGDDAPRSHSALGGEKLPPCLNNPAAWFGAVNETALQHCHSAPSHYTEQLAGELAADAAGSGSYEYAGSSSAYGGQYFLEELASRSFSESHCSMPELTGFSDSGSRSASPTKAGHNRRQNHNIDEDYQEKPSKNKGRSISRFGAEHKQQLDYTAVSSSSLGTPKKSPQRAVRRTSTGEPVRCANCNSDSTCLWRRDKEDPARTLCNACGIYKTNNGIDRPTNGLFPFWKNGKERVVRRNAARPIFKPYKHCVLTPEQYRQQRQQECMKNVSSSKGSSRDASGQQQMAEEEEQHVRRDPQVVGDVHPGALGCPTDLHMPTESLEEFPGYEVSAGQLPGSGKLDSVMEDPAALAALPAAEATSIPVPAAIPSQSASDTEQDQLTAAAAVSSGNPAALNAAVAAAQAAAAARARGSLSDQLNQADDGTAQLQAPGASTAAVSVAAAAATAAAGGFAGASTSAAAGPSGSSSAAAAGSHAPEMIGWVQQMSEVGVLGQLLHEAYTHAVQLHEPVMLPTGHKVHPDGRVLKCQVNNELGLMLPAGSQELAATVARVAAAISSGAVPSGLGHLGAPPKVTIPAGPNMPERLPAEAAAATAGPAISCTPQH